MLDSGLESWKATEATQLASFKATLDFGQSASKASFLLNGAGAFSPASIATASGTGSLWQRRKAPSWARPARSNARAGTFDFGQSYSIRRVPLIYDALDRAAIEVTIKPPLLRSASGGTCILLCHDGLSIP